MMTRKHCRIIAFARARDYRLIVSSGCTWRLEQFFDGLAELEADLQADNPCFSTYLFRLAVIG